MKEPLNVNVRIKISALWASMLFVFAYVDLFSLYRPDFRADLEAGEIGGFPVNQSFLLGTTVYVVIPSLMVFCALILRPRINRIANIALGIVYALTVIAGAIGEWNYYILGSAIEVGCPVRILQGAQDPDVPWQHAFALAHRLPAEDVVLTMIQDGDHRLSRPQDIARIMAAVAEMG